MPDSIRLVAGISRGVCVIAILCSMLPLPAQDVDLSTLPNARGAVFSHGTIGNFTSWTNPITTIGDFNNDGFSDFAIGIGDRGLPAISKGQVNVIYGSPARYNNFDLGTLVSDNTSGFQINGTISNGEIGRVITPIGDFNGDGYDDFAVRSYLGMTYIILGSAQPRTNFNITDLATNPSLGFVLNGAEIVTGAGDVNGDGYDDIIAGTSSGPPPFGVIKNNVIFGNPNPVSMDLANFTGDGDGGFIISWPAGFFFGQPPVESEFCDFNGDGYYDIILGGATAQFVGTNYIPLMIFPGRSSGFKNYTLRGSMSEGLYFPPDDLIYFELKANDPLPAYAYSWGCAGDFDSDGKSDLFISSTRFHEDDRTTAGMIYLLHGRSTGPGSIPLDLADPSTAGTRILGATGDRLGLDIVSAGDVDNDGKTDLLIRTDRPYADTHSSGSLFLIYGRNVSDGGIDLANPLSSDDGFKISLGLNYLRPINRAGDVDGDGYDDLLINRASPLPNATYLVYGNPKEAHIAGWEIY